MRVVYVRSWVRRALCSWFVLFALLLLVLVPDPPEPTPLSPYRHIPADYIQHRTSHANKYGSGCVSPPGFSQIQYSTAFWQHVSEPGEREQAVLVFAAYWDARERAKPLVRLLVHSDGELPILHCLFWYFNKGDPVMMTVSASEDSETNLHVLSCSPPTKMEDSPAALSVVPSGLICGMTRNILGIQGIPPAGAPSPTTPAPAAEGRRTAVCVTWWRRGDAAVRLAEWLQLLRYFKVNRVYLYINHHQAHSNVLRVIDYYSYHAELDGMTLDIMPYISPPNGTDDDVKVETESTAVDNNPAQGNDFDEYSEVGEKDDPNEGSEEAPPPISKDDLLPYNECIYRAMLDGIDWVAPLDLDETILPVRHGTWAELVTRESNKARHEINESPDELDFQRWWFPQLLQTDLPSSQPATEQLTNMDNRGGSRAPGDLSPETSSAAPRVVPPGRIFTYLWRASTARNDEVLTGKLLRVRSLVSVSFSGARCRSACSQRAVDPDVARLHKYTWGCGGASRRVCRLLRGAATREAALSKWRRAQQEAALTLRRIQLQAHDKSHEDDL